MGQLLGLRRADAAIVGGGLTGLLLGASLAHAGLRVAVLEAGDSLCGPAAEGVSLSCGTTLARVEAHYGPEIARQYASSLQEQLSALMAAPLPYARQAACYTYARQRTDLPSLEQHHALYIRFGLPVHIAPDADGCPFPVELSLFSQGVLVDVPRWMAALRGSIRRMGGRVYLHSRVIGFDGLRVCTEQGAVRAPLTVLTTGMPLGLHDKSLLALLESRCIARCTMTTDAPLHSLQQPVGAGLALCPTPGSALVSADIGSLGSRRQHQGALQFERSLRCLLPDWQPDAIQYTRRVLSGDGLPVIGALPSSRMLCAAGFGGCGILGAMHAAQVLTRRILGRALPEDALFSPTRKVPPALLRRQFAVAWASHFRRNAPACSHCGFRMRYFSPASRWECPLCGSACTMLGQPLLAPGMAPVEVSPRQRPN